MSFVFYTAATDDCNTASEEVPDKSSEQKAASDGLEEPALSPGPASALPQGARVRAVDILPYPTSDHVEWRRENEKWRTRNLTRLTILHVACVVKNTVMTVVNVMVESG